MLRMDSHVIERLKKQREKFLKTLEEKNPDAYEHLIKYREKQHK